MRLSLVIIVAKNYNARVNFLLLDEEVLKWMKNRKYFLYQTCTI